MRGNPIWTLEDIEKIVRELIAQSKNGIHQFELKIECCPAGITDRKLRMVIDYLKQKKIIVMDENGLLHKNKNYTEPTKREGKKCKLCEEAYNLLKNE